MRKLLLALLLIGCQSEAQTTPPDKLYLCEKDNGSVKYSLWMPDHETVVHKSWDIGVASYKTGTSFRDVETNKMILITDGTGFSCKVIKTREHI